MATRRRNAAPAPEVVEEEDTFEELEEDDDLEDLEDPDEVEEDDDEEEEEPAPVAAKKRGRPAKAAAAPAKKNAAAGAAKKKAPPVRQPVASGNDTNWLAGHVNEVCGTNYDSRTMRMLLRKMAADGELVREVGVDRGRYEWPKGEDDREVKLIIKRVKSGEVEKTRAAGIKQATESRAAKKATPAAKSAPAKAAPAARRKRTAAAK
jgi:hypothetical protein